MVAHYPMFLTLHEGGMHIGREHIVSSPSQCHTIKIQTIKGKPKRSYKNESKKEQEKRHDEIVEGIQEYNRTSHIIA